MVSTDIEFAGVDGVRGAEFARPVQLCVVGVHRDDPFRADQRGPRDRGVAHAAAADHRDGVVAGDCASVDRGTQPGHHPAAQQARDGRIDLRVDFGALTGRHQRLVSERPDAQCRRQLGAVGQRHLLLGVERVEAQVRLAALAGPALAAHRTPVQDHEVARCHRPHTRPDRFDRARGLVAEQEWILVVDPALAVVQVGVAHPAGADGDHGLTGPGVWHDDVHQLDGFTFFS